MRRASQSQYQPSTKSALGISKFNGGLQGSALIKSSVPSHKKIQGQDFGRTTKTNTFQQTVNKLKSKPNKKVLQDEYINGLQEEIKYLEYELKLLKDKQIMEREGVNQLDNFLKDQIPINENILAMKNKYNATKNTLEDQFKQLSAKNMQAGDVLHTQKNQIERLHEIIEGHRTQVGGRTAEFKGKLSEIVKQLTLTKSQYEVLTEDNKAKQDKMKKMSEDIANIQRGIEKDKVMEVRALEEKSKTLEKFEQKSKKVKEEMLEALQKVEELEIHAEEKGTNPLADQLEQKNSILRKKIMLNEKQKSTAENIISEMELFLKEEEREREIERKEKLKYTNSSDEARNELQNLQRFSDNMIKEQTLRYKKVFLKEMGHDLKEKEEIYDLLTDRLRILEQDCSNLIQEKKELQDSLETEASNEKEFEKKIKGLNNAILENRCTSDSVSRITNEILQETGPLRNQLEKCQGRIPLIEKDIEKKNATIHHMNKQVDLLKELKCLDLDRLQMISTSGVQMQNTLHDFIKNWEKLKSL